MVLRHSEYYFFGPVIYEFGYQQSFFGKLLIPVTASFGLALWLGREKVVVDYIGWVRLCLIFLVPYVLYYLHHGQFLNIFAFKFDSYVGRPQFIILIPIVLSVLIAKFLEIFSKKMQLIICFLIALLSILTKSFVLYYLSMFILGRYFLSYLFIKKWQLFKIVVSILFTVISILLIDTLKIYRIGFFWELTLGIVYLYMLFSLAFIFNRLHLKAFSFSVLYFYIFQASIFMFFKYIGYETVFTVFLVALVSFALSFYIKRLEKFIIKYIFFTLKYIGLIKNIKTYSSDLSE